MEIIHSLSLEELKKKKKQWRMLWTYFLVIFQHHNHFIWTLRGNVSINQTFKTFCIISLFLKMGFRWRKCKVLYFVLWKRSVWICRRVLFSASSNCSFLWNSIPGTMFPTDVHSLVVKCIIELNMFLRKMIYVWKC